MKITEYLGSLRVSRFDSFVSGIMFTVMIDSILRGEILWPAIMFCLLSLDICILSVEYSQKWSKHEKV